MLSAAVLQILAISTMVIDHIGLYFFPDCWFLRLIGRLAFPLFAFMIVEGFKHTHSRVQYFTRLLICAIISELPVFILATTAHIDYIHNVLFLFALSIPMLFCIKRGGFITILVPIFALVASGLKIDYGAYGMFLIAGIYLVDGLFEDKYWLRQFGFSLVFAATMIPFAINNNAPMQYWSFLALIPIALYSGKKGRRLPQLVRYAFYPVHLFIILFLRLALY